MTRIRRPQIRFPRKSATLPLCALMAALLSMAAPAAESKSQSYSSIGAGSLGEQPFRTLFSVLNEGTAARTGQLDFFAAARGDSTLRVTQTWVGEAGTVLLSGSRATFSIPPRSSLELATVPSDQTSIGWARMQLETDLTGRAFMQIGRRPPGPATSADFENRLEKEVEIFPTPGVKRFSFPVFLFAGESNVRTAFSIVNLSAVPGTARLTLRPANSRTLALNPGELVADFFDRFWQLAFPAIFPLRFQGMAQVESDVPLAATVLRTSGGLPLSGVPVLPLPSVEEIVEMPLGGSQTLAAGQTALIRSENLKISFWDVTEDSRCPIDAVCIQQGRATVALRITKDDRDLGEFFVSTESSLATTSADRYSIRLTDVQPARRAASAPKISDYQITIFVARN